MAEKGKAKIEEIHEFGTEVKDQNEVEETAGEDIEDLIQPSSSDEPPGGKTYQGLPPNLAMEQLMSILQLKSGQATSTAAESKKEKVSAKKEDHAFWKSQPIPDVGEDVSENGPYEPDKKPEEVRQTPYSLPDGYEWSEIDVENETELKELYTLLTMNYVEDEDAMFRFDYSPEFLKWALLIPGWKKSWFPGVRVASSKKLVAFISAIPGNIRVYDREQFMVEVNFLCVHKKLRAKRLAPVLIKEITRRVHVTGNFQAVYTAGLKLPGQIASCRYFHRSLNPKKLVETGFSHVGRNNTLARMIQNLKLPEAPQTKGFKPMQAAHIPVVYPMLKKYLEQFKLAPHFSEAEFRHYFTTQDKVVYSYVVEDPATKQPTDFVSFYSLPSTVINHPLHKTLNVAYSYYYATTKTPLTDLMRDCLIEAKKKEFDVFNCLTLMHNQTFLTDLKFGAGDGELQFYLYNWKCTPVGADGVGLVLL